MKHTFSVNVVIVATFLGLCAISEIIAALNSFGIYQRGNEQIVNLAYYTASLLATSVVLSFFSHDIRNFKLLYLFSIFSILIGVVSVIAVFLYLIGINYFYRQSSITYQIFSGAVGIVIYNFIRLQKLLEPRNEPL